MQKSTLAAVWSGAGIIHALWLLPVLTSSKPQTSVLLRMMDQGLGVIKSAPLMVSYMFDHILHTTQFEILLGTPEVVPPVFELFLIIAKMHMFHCKFKNVISKIKGLSRG